MRHMLRYCGILLALQVVFSGLGFWLSDWIGVAVLAPWIYLWLVWQAGALFAADWDGSRRSTAGAAVLIGFIWQMPGLQGSIRFLSDTVGWTEYDGITDLQDFLMETWHTVFMPVFSHAGSWSAGYYAPYYFGLVLASPLLMLLFLSASLWKLQRPGRT